MGGIDFKHSSMEKSSEMREPYALKKKQYWNTELKEPNKFENFIISMTEQKIL